MKQPVNVFLSGSSDTVEVTLTSWDKHDENGTGVLASGEEVTVFQSYDGDGFLEMSDQDTEWYQAKQEFENIPSYVERFKDGREPVE